MPDSNQMRMARIALEQSLAEVAEAVGVTRSVLAMLESGAGAEPEPALIARLKAHFEAGGVQFGPDGQVTLRPGLRLAGPRSVH